MESRVVRGCLAPPPLWPRPYFHFGTAEMPRHTPAASRSAAAVADGGDGPQTDQGFLHQETEPAAHSGGARAEEHPQT